MDLCRTQLPAFSWLASQLCDMNWSGTVVKVSIDTLLILAVSHFFISAIRMFSRHVYDHILSRNSNSRLSSTDDPPLRPLRRTCQPYSKVPPSAEPTFARALPNGNSVELRGWPSVGGVIVLQNVTHVDFAFLGLDPLDIPYCRAVAHEDEDVFCQQLLRLGAKWFDSENRLNFAWLVFRSTEDELLEIESGRRPDLTRRERRWIRVGWPTDGKGLWVAEFDMDLFDEPDEYDPIPPWMGEVSLARNMDERCEILKKLGAKFYETLEDYDGLGFLNAWGHKTTGEVGELKENWP